MTMANAATDPLLASSQEAAAAKEPSIDDVIETYIGDTGALQQQVFISALTDAEPRWHCLAAGSTTGNNSSCSPAPSASPCALPPGSWAWDRPAMTSVVSEWTLTCAGPALVSLPASSFFAGCLAGGFLLATLADSLLGRKTMLVAALASMSLTGALTALAPNVWAYAALRFVSGFARSSPRRWSGRGAATRRRGGTCTCGRHCPASATPSCSTSSSRSRRGGCWCAAGGTTPSRRCARSCRPTGCRRRRPASPCWTPCTPRRGAAVGAPEAGGDHGGQLRRGDGLLRHAAQRRQPGLRPLPERRVQRAGRAAVGGARVGPNRQRGRAASRARRSLGAGRGAAAARMAAEVVSFFAACTAFDVMLVYATELFPTSARSSAVGMVRQALVLGGAAAPVLIALGRERVSLFCSFGVFGVAIGCSGLFVACLPETRGKSMSDTMEEVEERNRAVVVASCTGATTAGTTDSGSCIV
ncbi:unnamed protein product [Urochloa decumbens]|uniref:H(+)/Pi cotransporter n=1 Tax=Urochloa decumbens TaxID=240449 RepID=A0ABC8XCE9_9POAL